jgi:hypothetical protein
MRNHFFPKMNFFQPYQWVAKYLHNINKFKFRNSNVIYLMKNVKYKDQISTLKFWTHPILLQVH